MADIALIDAIQSQPKVQATKGPQKSVVLSCKNLCRNFGGFAAVNNVNLDVVHGEVHALIGPNGAGKTTVFNLLTKFLQPSSGRIYFMDEDITNMSPSKVARMGLVRSFQISATFPGLTVLENVRVALQRTNGLASQFWSPMRRLDRLNSRAAMILTTVGLVDVQNSLAADLSYGRKRVLEIATTLALEPKVLLLDEPMAGMGQEDISRIAELICAISKNHAVLMVEHNLNVVADLCHRVTVLQRGEILASGDYETVSADARVRLAYMGSHE